MATTSKVLARGAATTTSATLYTVTSNTTTVVTNIVISNNSATDATANLSLDGVSLIPGVTIGGNSITAIDLKQVLAATKTITGYGSSTSISWHISGVEIV